MRAATLMHSERKINCTRHDLIDLSPHFTPCSRPSIAQDPRADRNLGEQETGCMADGPLRRLAKGRHPWAASAVVVGLSAIAVVAVSEAPRPVTSSAPKRVVSLDYCADQFVLKFAE